MKAQKSAENVGKIILAILAFGLLRSLLSHKSTNGHALVHELFQLVLVALILAIVAAAAYYGIKITYALIIKNSTKSRIRQTVETHKAALVRRRAQLLRADGYGGTISKKWEEEIVAFLTTYALPTSPKDWMRNKNEWIALVDSLVSQAASENPAFQTFSRDMRPSEFEAFCASELQEAGWDANITAATGDQGVDVIAEKDGIRFVLQCKLYNHPVGNKAVQEAFAAKRHEAAQIAAVVSNNRFTASAEQLAASTGVLLLHYSELRFFDPACPPRDRPVH